jgi:hypothetical protein
VNNSITLAVNDLLDLDTAQLNAANGNDLAYQTDADGYHLLVPQTGALLGVYGGSQPARDVCLSAGMSTAPIAVESLSSGTYLCYHTDQGLPGWLRLSSVNAADFSISLDVLTWASVDQ